MAQRLRSYDRAQSARAGLAVDGLAGNGAQGRVRPPQDRGFRLLVTGNGIKLLMLPTVRHEDSATSTRKKNNPGKELEARMQQVPTDTKRRMPSSRVLEEVIHQAPAEYVTVGWLTSTLHRHSFGIIMLSLGLLPRLRRELPPLGSLPHPKFIAPTSKLLRTEISSCSEISAEKGLRSESLKNGRSKAYSISEGIYGKEAIGLDAERCTRDRPRIR